MSNNVSDWQMHNCTCFHEYAVQLMMYDSFRELLWCGYQDGRVNSFSTNESGLIVYSSFKLNSQIVGIVPVQKGIICITLDEVCYYGVGGNKRSTMQIKDLLTIPEGDNIGTSFSSASLVSDSLLGNLFTSNNINTCRIMIGMNISTILLLEINHESYEMKSVVQYSLSEASVIQAPNVDITNKLNISINNFTITDIISNHHHLYISGSNGKFYILDGKILLKVVSTMNHRLKHTTLNYIPNFSGNGVIIQSFPCYDKGGYITHLALDRLDCKTMYYCGVITVTNGNGFKGIVEGMKV